MKIHLLRHGETNWNRNKRLQGQRDVPIDDTGKRQIEQFCQQTRQDYTLIVTSPLRRAVESAEICSRWFALPSVVEPAFAERTFGDLEGMCKDDICRKFLIEDVEALEATHSVESRTDFQARLELGLERLRRHYLSERILLVTHGSVIRLLLDGMSSNYRGPCGGTTRLSPSFGVVPNGCEVVMDIS
ncbi:histidine phosphatase family protein [Alicyclobacillus curvatus]|nr:histidine phosphatase family protein [Alicyclobacillus curvatus]